MTWKIIASIVAILTAGTAIIIEDNRAASYRLSNQPPPAQLVKQVQPAPQVQVALAPAPVIQAVKPVIAAQVKPVLRYEVWVQYCQKPVVQVVNTPGRATNTIAGFPIAPLGFPDKASAATWAASISIANPIFTKIMVPDKGKGVWRWEVWELLTSTPDLQSAQLYVSSNNLLPAKWSNPPVITDYYPPQKAFILLTDSQYITPPSLADAVIGQYDQPLK